MLLDANDDIEVVGEAGNARDAVFRARELKPAVILMDVMMPDQSGIDALPQLLHEYPETKILILSMQDDPRYVREAFAAGASGYVLRRIRSRIASTKCSACSPSAIRTRRSRSSSSSRSARPRRTGRTSCRSCGSPRAPSSSGTHWIRVS